MAEVQEVCPWCRSNHVAARGPLGEPTCRSCLAPWVERTARCGCGIIVEPADGLYEVHPNGAITCCFCLAAQEERSCHWCSFIECRNGECQKFEE